MTQLASVPKDIRNGSNSTGSTIAKSLAVTRGAGDALTKCAGTTAVFSGLTMEAIADGERGDYHKGGIGIGTAGTGGWSAGNRLMPEAGGTGKLVPWSAAAGTNATIVGAGREDCAQDEEGEVELGDGKQNQG